MLELLERQSWNLPIDATSASQTCIFVRWKEPWIPTVNGEGLEEAYAKTDRPKHLHHAKSPIAGRQQ